jgi:acyl-CoA thioesterase II
LVNVDGGRSGKIDAMGNLADDTAVSGRNGQFTAELSRDWEIWGPNGGYVASVALRAAAAHTELVRPASFQCHFLSIARFEEVQLEVRTLRKSKRVESMAVSMRQNGTAILEAIAWFVADGDGLVHDHAVMPAVAAPAERPFITELLPPDEPMRFRFWMNFEHKPLDWWDTPADRPPGEPEFLGWYRYAPVATFADPAVDACRSLLLCDTMGWPAATRAHPWDIPWMAPNIDLAVQFHRAAPETDWLLIDAVAPVAEDGLIGFRTQVWSEAGSLLASGSGQLLCRPVPS